VAANRVDLPCAPRSAPKIATHRITLLGDWVAAVERHTPGEVDDAAIALSRWSAAQIALAWIDLQALIAIVERPRATRFAARPDGRTIDVSESPSLATLRELSGLVRTRPGGSTHFYKRAAVLHADIAMHVAGASGRSPTGSLIVETGDGTQLGVHGNLAHWEFGRLFVDALRPASLDPFVRDWYRASLAYKLSIGELDTPHFDRAVEILPRDPIVRFQLGCLHEWFADARVQTASSSVRLPRGIYLAVRDERDELRAAAEQFERTLAVDPGHTEARVRQGRVLFRLGRHDAAARVLRAAAAEGLEPLVAYYAHLFLGATEEALERTAHARAAYTRAAALYPRAQAPHLALSQLFDRSGDRPAARRALASVLPPTRGAGAEDPWWTYRRACSRHTPDLVAALYRTLAGEVMR
jgi:tetratricopeptide (TPR) repeat protein